MRISDWSSDVCSSDLFRESVARLDPPWVSEHLAFLRAGRGRQAFNTGFLLPPLQSRETIETSVRNIRQLQAAIGRPLAFEIAANYLKPLPGEMTDGEFIAEIAERADCGILRSEGHTSELQSLMRLSYDVFCLKKQIKTANKKQT